MTRPHHYVECDVPEGMTLRDYRAAKGTSRAKRGIVARLRARRAAARRAATAAAR